MRREKRYDFHMTMMLSFATAADTHNLHTRQCATRRKPLCHTQSTIRQRNDGDLKVQSVPFSKAKLYHRPNWFTLHAFRKTSDPHDVISTDRRQNPTLLTGSRWTFYATFASLLRAAVVFGLRDIKQLRQQVPSHGYHRVRIERNPASGMLGTI